MSEPENKAVFVGLATLDVILSVTRVPHSNEKVVALNQCIAAGGPAANAAVTASFLGTKAALITGLGSHPLTAGIANDLEAHGVRLIDLNSASNNPPSVSAIMITSSTGDRAVVSRNAEGQMVEPPANLYSFFVGASALLVDGHHPQLALEAVRVAREAGIITVLDAGSWKPITKALLPFIDVAICSSDFHPPGEGSTDVLRYLVNNGVLCAAVTTGGNSIRWIFDNVSGTTKVESVPTTDTVGAGDILHGAFIHYISGEASLTARSFEESLKLASVVASKSCQYFGTREWMRESSVDSCQMDSKI